MTMREVASGTRYDQLFFEDVKEGQELPRLNLDITFKRVIQDVAATRDYFPGHHDPEYAKAQSQKAIYLNTMFFQGFIDRVVTDWAGPITFIARRKMRMQASVYAGDKMYGEGKVTRSYLDDTGRGCVDIDIIVGNQDGPTCPASVTAVLPRRSGD